MQSLPLPQKRSAKPAAQQKAVHERRRRPVPLVGKIEELSRTGHTLVVAAFDDSDNEDVPCQESLLIQKCFVHRTIHESSHTLSN